MSTYENPARLFLENHAVESVADVIAYADFLRLEAGLSGDPPINIQRIIDRFGMHTPKALHLPKQQGAILSKHGIPQIIVHVGDAATRQKYTTAHELIELLFLALPGNRRFDGKKENIFGVAGKERVCQVGAANLLMPMEGFRPRAIASGLSFQTAELLADEYEVSLMAALCRLTDIYAGLSAVLLWKKDNKPADLKRKIPEGQFEMPGFSPQRLVAPKLRIAWGYGGLKGTFFPRHKSIADDSSVYEAWEKDGFCSRVEPMPSGKTRRSGYFESKGIIIEGEKCVLTLITEAEEKSTK